MFDFINLDFTNFTAFLFATLVISLITGPDVAFVASRSIAGGKRSELTRHLECK